MTATCLWDSSIHACTNLNRSLANGNELVYICVNVSFFLCYVKKNKIF